MARLIFDDFAVINGSIVKEYTTADNETVPVCVFSQPSSFAFDTLSVIDNVLQPNAGFSVTDWGEVFELCAIKEPASPAPIAICQKSAVHGGKEYLLTCYRDSSIKVLVESADEHMPIIPAVKIASPQIIVDQGNNYLNFVVKSTYAEGEHILAIAAAPEMSVLLEAYGNSVAVDNNCITVTKTFEDMCMRQRVSRYELNNGRYQLNSHMFKYANEHIYIDCLKPYLLLEALSADDMEYAQMLLSDELGENAAALKDFFGEFERIDYPKYGKKDADIAVIGKDGKARCYQFEYSDGSISNIRLLD